VNNMNYLGLDIHKKTISYCLRQADGTILREGTIEATREALTALVEGTPQPWSAGLEATMFSAWIYDHIRAQGGTAKVAHSPMLRAIAAGKRKNDRLDARKIADLLRCDYFPECHMAAPEIRNRRRVLRYRNLLVRQAVRMKTKVSGLLMETGIPYNKKKLHSKKYFYQLLEERRAEMPESLPELLQLSRLSIETLTRMDYHLLSALEHDRMLAARVERLMTIPGVGTVVALTWALEIGDVRRFTSLKKVVSYCGLCGAERSSAGKQRRTPISKQRNHHLQTVLVEAAKLAPRWHSELALVYDREKQRGNRNRATLAVARKLAAYLLAVDRGGRGFQEAAPSHEVSRVA
jgi:transposase